MSQKNRRRISGSEMRHRHGLTQADSFIRAHMEYNRAETYGAKRAAYEKSIRTQGSLPSIYLAEMALDLAVLATNDSEKSHYLEHIPEHVQKATATAFAPHQSIENELFIANVPLLTSVHIEREHPGTARINKAKERVTKATLKAASDVDTAIAYTREIGKDKKAEVFGMLSEAAVLLMLQHAATQQIHTPTEQDYTPVPSLFSDNHSKNSRTAGKSSWDVSVFTFDLDTDAHVVEPTYKVQVKSFAQKGEYSDDIALVTVGYLDQQRKTSVLGVAKDIASIILGNPTNTNSERWTELRTDRIMQIMDGEGPFQQHA